MKTVLLYKIAEIEDTLSILDHFGVEYLSEIPKQDLLDHLLEEFGEPDLDECDFEQFDLLDDDSFLAYRVDEEDEDKGYLLYPIEFNDETLAWSYFKITESEY